MTIGTVATVDFTSQAWKISAPPGETGPTEVWGQDGIIRLMYLLGMINVSFEADSPSDTTKMWFDRGSPATGNPGTLKRYDAETETWVAVTPSTFGAFFVASDSYVSAIDQALGTSAWRSDAKNNFAGTIPPTGTDDSEDGYSVGSIWVDTEADRIYVCVDATAGAALWRAIVNRNSTAADFPVSGVTAGSYARATITVDQAGRITAASANASGDVDFSVLVNFIRNAGMRFTSASAGASGTATGYEPVDGFFVDHSQDGTLTSQQVASAAPSGSPNRLRVTVSSNDSSLSAGQYALIRHDLIGAHVADLKFGGASAKQIIVRFGWKSPAGTYAVALSNAADNRTYVAEFTIGAGDANTDTVQTVVIPGDTSGTWLTTDATAMQLRWTLATGSTFQTTANAWQSNEYYGTASTSNGIGTSSAVFELYDVALYADPELTGEAPTFVLPPYDVERAQLGILRSATAPTPTAEGEVWWDTDDNTIKVGDGSSTKTFSDDSARDTARASAIASAIAAYTTTVDLASTSNAKGASLVGIEDSGGLITASNVEAALAELATSISTAGKVKAWVNFNGTGTVAIRASYNVSSITDHGTGEWTVNMTTAISDADYCVVTATNGDVLGAYVSNNITPQTTTTFRLKTINGAYASTDTAYVYAAVLR